jgi:hypothetical protein
VATTTEQDSDQPVLFERYTIQTKQSNAYPASIGYLFDKKIEKQEILQNNPYANQDAIAKIVMNDPNFTMFDTLTVKAVGGKFTVTAKNGGTAYIYLKDDDMARSKYWVNDHYKHTKKKLGGNALVRLGNFRANKPYPFDVTKLSGNKIQKIKDGVRIMNEAKLNQVLEKMNQNQFLVQSLKRSMITGIVEPTQAQTLFLSIPYNESFVIKVDGKKVPIKRILSGFIGVDVTPGKHEVVIKYVATQFFTGLIISIISLVVLLLTSVGEVVFLKKHLGKHSPKIE